MHSHWSIITPWVVIRTVNFALPGMLRDSQQSWPMSKLEWFHKILCLEARSFNLAGGCGGGKVIFATIKTGAFPPRHPISSHTRYSHYTLVEHQQMQHILLQSSQTLLEQGAAEPWRSEDSLLLCWLVSSGTKWTRVSWCLCEGSREQRLPYAPTLSLLTHWE